MYSKEQVSTIKQAFWTAFGQYMAVTPNSEGLRINWINYKTGIKHLYFKMQTDNRSALISIEMSHPDTGMQELIFEQFTAFKKLIEAQLNEEWIWELHSKTAHGKTISRIYTTLPDHSFLKQEDWPALISFFKTRIVALDAFWSDAQYSFDVFK